MPLSNKNMLRFICECPNQGCWKRIDISPDEYLAAFSEFGNNISIHSAKCEFPIPDADTILFKSDRYLVVITDFKRMIIQ